MGNVRGNNKKGEEGGEEGSEEEMKRGRQKNIMTRYESLGSEGKKNNWEKKNNGKVLQGEGRMDKGKKEAIKDMRRQEEKEKHRESRKVARKG